MGERRLLARLGHRLELRDGLQRPVRPATGSAGRPGYSYWSDGKGWENSPGASARRGHAARPAASPFDAARCRRAGGVPVAARRRRPARQREPGRPDGGLPGRGRRPDGRLRCRARLALAARCGPGGPGGPGLVRAVPAGPAAPAAAGGRQAQGQLVAALDVEEGARRHRRRWSWSSSSACSASTSTCPARATIPAALAVGELPEHDRLLQRRQDGHRHDRHDQPAGPDLSARSPRPCRTRWSPPRTGTSGPRAASRRPASCARPTTT